MPGRRLPAPSTSEIERARVPFSFDGRRYEGIAGEPVAVSLLAAGRRTLSRSFRFHRPRGLMCSTGQCGWCECEVDGRPSMRTCRVPLQDGMVVRGEHAKPSVEHDLLQVLDLGSRFVPPTFYHHRFLRPRRLRKVYLEVIRSFGGRGRLGGGLPSHRQPRSVRRDTPEVLVVGGGRGGLLAAIGAAEVGARAILLEAEAGANPHDLLAEAQTLGVDVRTATVATGWYDGMVTAMNAEAIWELRPRAVVSATGSYELVPAVEGSDRPGVMSARLVLRLLREHRVCAGDRALLVGDGEELETAGAALREVGATVVGPVPTSGLRSIGGRGSVGWAWVVGAAEAARRERVDVVVFGDRTPNVDLVLAAGGRLVWHDRRLAPQADADGRTSVSGLFVAGEAAGGPARGAAADAQARRAGRAAGTFARPPSRIGGQTARAVPRAGDPPRSQSDGHPPASGSARAILCFCEDVRGWEIQAERAAGYADPELVKRRTGALTGPCQGKYCLSAVTCAMNDSDGPATGVRHAPGAEPAGSEPAGTDQGIVLPTGRPPLRPIHLGDLVAEDST